MFDALENLWRENQVAAVASPCLLCRKPRQPRSDRSARLKSSPVETSARSEVGLRATPRSTLPRSISPFGLMALLAIAGSARLAGSEITRSAAVSFENFEATRVNALLKDLQHIAHSAIAPALGRTKPTVSIVADCRYVGQGHEIRISIPAKPLKTADGAKLKALFEKAYKSVYGLNIPGQAAEAISLSVTVSGPMPVIERPNGGVRKAKAKPLRHLALFDAKLGRNAQAPVFWRFDLPAGQAIKGPAIIAEHETSTIVGSGWTARKDSHGNIILERKS